MRGSWGAAPVNGLEPQEGDHVVEKMRMNGFYDTKLDILLRGLGAETLVITGAWTNMSIEHTARHAADAGYARSSCPTAPRRSTTSGRTQRLTTRCRTSPPWARATRSQARSVDDADPTREAAGAAASAGPAWQDRRVVSVNVSFLKGEQPVVASRRGSGVEAAVEKLLAGPTAAETKKGIRSQLPAGVRVKSLTVEHGVASIDLGAKFASGTSAESLPARFAQLVLTLTEVPGVDAVKVRVDGDVRQELYPGVDLRKAGDRGDARQAERQAAGREDQEGPGAEGEHARAREAARRARFPRQGAGRRPRERGDVQRRDGVPEVGRHRPRRQDRADHAQGARRGEAPDAAHARPRKASASRCCSTARCCS